MTIHQMLLYFMCSIKGSSLKSMSIQMEKSDYRSLIAFFHKQWNAQELLVVAAQGLFSLVQGYLVLDEIVLQKHSLGGFWIVTRKYKSDGGFITPAVLLIWTNGAIQVPVRFELRHPGSGSATASAMRLVSWARSTMEWKPEYILFDAGFASQKLLKRLNDYGWMFVCRIPRTRLFNGIPLWQFKRQGYWNAVGRLSNGLKVKAIRRADTFYLTNRLMKDADEVVHIYGKRHVIEEIFRILKQECHWDRCQLRCENAYERFLAIGCLSLLSWESLRTSIFQALSIYKLRRSVLFDHLKLDFSLPDSLWAMANL